MVDFTKIQAAAQQLEETGPDLNEAQTGGGDYTPPAAGPTRIRFVGYVELGTHTTQFQGKDKTKPRALLTFELNGPKHQPRVGEDGTVYPDLITVTETVSLHEKGNYLKLFKKMAAGYEGTKNFAQLLGKAFRGTIFHETFKGRDGKDRIRAKLRDDSGYSLTGTQYEDPETGEVRTVKVDEAVTPLKLFLWDYPDLEFWDSLYVEGAWDDGESKNKVQNKIKEAADWVGSPMYDLLVSSGRKEEVTASAKAKPAAQPAADEGDALEEAPAKAPAKTAKAAPAAAKGVVAAKPKKPVAAPVEDEDETDPLADLA